MRFLNLDYQAKVLNRLARKAARKGFPVMVGSLNRAQWRVWEEIEAAYYQEVI